MDIQVQRTAKPLNQGDRPGVRRRFRVTPLWVKWLGIQLSDMKGIGKGTIRRIDKILENGSLSEIK